MTPTIKDRIALLRLCLLFFLVFGLLSCADYRLHRSAENEAPPATEPPEAPVHTLYLIGDTGPPAGAAPSPAMQLLGRHLADAPKNSSLVFLGNTLHPNGMAPKEAADERADDEAMLRAQLDLVRDFPGRLFFVAGDRDWADYGVDGLQRQRDFIEEYLERDDLWEPTCGCGDPKEIDLTDELVLLLLDSQWWLTDWTGEPEVNKRCEAKSRDYFKLLYADAIKGNREKNIVVAMHHPVFSKGPHGGAFTARQHLFPLTDINDKLWLPLPGIGSLYPFYRASVGTPQDLANPEYQDLRNYLLDVARVNGRFIFAAGHENSLQYLEKENQHIVVSGAGAARTATRMTEGVHFAYGHQGFAQLDFFEDGAVWLRFWAAELDGESTLVFQRQIKGPLPTPAPPADSAFTALTGEETAVEAPMVGSVLTRQGLGRWLWGEHYRDAYGLTMNYPVLDLNRFRGGVEPVKMGGGYQTNSLRLQAADERQYTMRSIDKDPTRTVPYPMNRSSFVLDIVKDAFTASHPMSALPIPRLADAVGVYHTNPKVYYVPRQPALDRYNEDFGDALYLVEERPDDKVWSDHTSFGRPYDIESTTDVVEKITDKQDHRIDLEAVVRARTFDLFLGDWDRHDDQWRWAQFDQDSVDIYRPIPRDRDQAFCKYDGFLYNIVNKSIPPARPMRPYQPYQKKIQWSNFGPRHFDATFLGGASWELWENTVRHLQENLPDSLIESAFREAWPAPVYELDGAETVRIAQQRRDHLMQMAREFYEFRSRKVDVLGTNEEDIFEVTRASDGAVTVAVYPTNKKGKRQAPFFQRTFLPEETKEITLYGLRDDDVFHLSGKAKRGPLIRIVGGLGEETVNDESKVSGLARKTVVYDAREEDIELNTGGETRIRLKKDPRYNTYNRRAHDYDFNYSRIVPSARYNPDDGILLRLSPIWYTYGFKKSPFASEQSVMLKYATANAGFEISYQGTFIDVIGKQDLLINAVWRNPLYTYNFYGLGNETENPEDEKGADFNRVRQRYIAVAPSIQHRLRGAASYSFGPTFESHLIDTIGGRFIDEIAPSLNQEMFEGLEFLGAYFRFRVENLDDPLFPTHGLRLLLTTGWKWSLEEDASNFPYFQGQAAIYQQIDGGGRLVFASRLGGEHIFNNKFEFFQGARLGGSGPDRNFRGFRRDRFTGRSSFYHNNDLRWKAIQSENQVIPFSLGFFTGFDYGRVWVDGEDSDLWHYSYGGGFWFSPFNLMDLRFDWFRGDGIRNRFSFSGRFFF